MTARCGAAARTSILRGLACSAIGIVKHSTPFVYVASIEATSSPSPRPICRTKLPDGRSCTSHLADSSELTVRVAVLKALGGNPKLPFIAVLTQGFPRLTTLNAELVIPTHDGKPLPPGVRAHVLVRDDVAMIPDLEWIEASLLDLLDDAGPEESVESSGSFDSQD